MIAPGMTITANRVVATSGSGTVADFMNQGIGFMNDGSVAMDEDAPAGNYWKEGTRLNSSGAIYVLVTTTDPSDVFISGLRNSALGQLIVEKNDGDLFINGNPVDIVGGFLCTT